MFDLAAPPHLALLNAIPRWLGTIVVSALPVAELRLGLPLAVLVWKMHPVSAYLLAVAGNLLPVLPLLFFWKFLADRGSSRFSFFQKFSDRLYSKIKKRHTEKFRKFKGLALLVFVAIPLPGTGVWTAAVAAAVFKIPVRQAALMISLGALLAGAFVLLALWPAKGLVF